MRIAMTGDGEAPGAIYRVNHLGQELERRGHTVMWPTDELGSLTYEQVAASDALYVYRFRNDRVQRAARTFMAKGVALVWDNDDDVSAAPPDAGLDTLAAPGVRAEFLRDSIAMAKMAQVATFASSTLADLYRAQGAPDARVIENAPWAVARERERDARVVVGWVAGKEHAADLNQVPIVEALAEVQRRHPDVHVETLGVRLPLDDRYRHVAFMPFDAMLRRLTKYDIGIAPLADTPFNRARSSIKIKEYAAAGVPWLASPLPSYAPYAAGCGGRVVPDDGWVEALDALVTDAAERQRLAAEGQTWAESQRISATVVQWEAAFERAVARLQSRRGAPAGNGRGGAGRRRAGRKG